MSARTLAANDPAARAALAQHLTRVLDDLSDAYTQLRVQVDVQREAIRAADTQAIARSLDHQQRLARTIAQADQQRRELVLHARRVLPGIAQHRAEVVTLTDVIRALPQEQRAGLEAKAGMLKALVQDVAQRTATMRAATATLLAHMEGLIRQVGRTLSHAGTYSRRGIVDPGGLVVSGVDLRS